MLVGEMCLYIMQNQHGCIKIGRSVDVEQRRHALASLTKRDIAVVCKFPRCGEYEEKLLLAVRKHILFGEWFVGSKGARKEIVRESVSILVTNRPLKYHALLLEEAANLLTPPYEWQQQAAEAWMKEFCESQVDKRVRKERARLIARLKAASAGMYVSGYTHLNFDIFFELFERRRRCLDPDHSASIFYRDAPCYLSDAALARELWPQEMSDAEVKEQIGPKATILDICIAGLGARWDIDWHHIKPRLN